MNKMVKFPLILALTGTICATALGVVYQIANPIIEERVNAAANEAIGAVLPGAKGSDITKDFESKKDLMKKYGVSTIYEVTKDGKKIGNGYKLVGSGKIGNIELLVLLDDTKVLGVKVLSQGETPSYYEKVEAANYEAKFKDVPFESLAGFETVAGATGSSTGIKNTIIAASDAHKEIVLGETVGPKEIVTAEEFAKLGYTGETFELATEQFKEKQGKAYTNKFVGTGKDKNGITDAFYRKDASGNIIGYVYYFEANYNCEVAEGKRMDQTYRGLFSFDKGGANSKLVILTSGDSLTSIGKPGMADMELIDQLQGFNINDVRSAAHSLPDHVAGATFTSKSIVKVITTICVNHKDF